MNERLEHMKQWVRNGVHHSVRRSEPIEVLTEFEAQNYTWLEREAHLLMRQCEAETVIIHPDERIVYTRTLTKAMPEVMTPEEWKPYEANHIHSDQARLGNICADWGKTLSQGLNGRRQVAWNGLQKYAGDAEKVALLKASIESIDAVQGLADRYAETARQMGREDVAEVFARVPANPPATFHEALQSLFFLHSMVWLAGHNHVGLGRFDQYMMPYLRADLDNGRLTLEQATDLLAEFFIALNKNSDLYPGVQQGDNGQTLTIGGVDRQGKNAVNLLTHLVLSVSREVAMIDPKINLRISATTPLDLLEEATLLTRKGLGFPQYSNEDVVIPGLVAHGYDLEDARDYVVAACWEFIIPGRGMEVVNIGAVSFPYAVDAALRAGLPAGEAMPAILQRVAQNIKDQVDSIGNWYQTLMLPPAPFYTVLMSDNLEEGRDLADGAKYNNFGIHGAGSANAADALAAVEQVVLEEKAVTPAELIHALDVNFTGYEPLRLQLAEQAPKIGNNNPQADAYLATLFDDLAEACESFGRTTRGGIIRPGTGSAMYYLWLARGGRPDMREPVVGATAEGRLKGMPFGANLSATQGAPIRGPISVLQSFSKINYMRICNGGPITIELSDSVFRDEESIHKVAMFVRTFVMLGCQQMQVNSLSVEQLKDAKLHPEAHRNLIVRVWGWSGYFTELDEEYQDQIIARHICALG